MNSELIIIGGGAAGMMTAVLAARNGIKTCIFERNTELGKKLAITGKGRCNVTNACDNEDLINNVISGKKFLMSAFSKFSPWDTMDFFENLGVSLKTERGNRVFPVSDNAHDVVLALESELKRNNVKIINERCTEILTEDNKIIGIETESGKYLAKYVVVATGGLSYPKTGSTGDGYSFAKKTGHKIIPQTPCLVPLEVVQLDLCREMMGLSLRNITLKLFENNKCIYEELGEMLFAHFGITGPLILKASAYIKNSKSGNYKVVINCKPALSIEKLDARILRDFAISPNRTILNVMKGLLPSKMVEPMLKISQISPETKVNSITKLQRQTLEKNITSLTLDVKNFRPVAEAIVTAGGVDLKDINPKSMESKKIENLFFVGECLDAHAFTGGFNLQIAFATANAAAQAITLK